MDHIQKQDGFLLIEALVGLMLLATIIASIQISISQQSRTISKTHIFMADLRQIQEELYQKMLRNECKRNLRQDGITIYSCTHQGIHLTLLSGSL